MGWLSFIVFCIQFPGSGSGESQQDTRLDIPTGREDHQTAEHNRIYVQFIVHWQHIWHLKSLLVLIWKFWSSTQKVIEGCYCNTVCFLNNADILGILHPNAAVCWISVHKILRQIFTKLSACLGTIWLWCFYCFFWPASTRKPFLKSLGSHSLKVSSFVGRPQASSWYIHNSGLVASYALLMQ